VEAESIAYMVLCRLDPTFQELPDGVGLRQMIQVASDIMKMGAQRLPGDGRLADGASATLF
jgi:hypothetical protein